jgi:hypothetical protein
MVTRGMADRAALEAVARRQHASSGERAGGTSAATATATAVAATQNVRFADWHHAEFKKNALASIRRAYSALELPAVSRAFELGAQRFESGDGGAQRHREGTHHYSLDQFGLTSEQISSDRELAIYASRFGERAEK